MHCTIRSFKRAPVGRQRRNGVPQAKSGEEDKLLDFVKNPVGGDDLLGNGPEDDVDAVSHKAHQRLHDNGKQLDYHGKYDAEDKLRFCAELYACGKKRAFEKQHRADT